MKEEEPVDGKKSEDDGIEKENLAILEKIRKNQRQDHLNVSAYGSSVLPNLKPLLNPNPIKNLILVFATDWQQVIFVHWKYLKEHNTQHLSFIFCFYFLFLFPCDYSGVQKHNNLIYCYYY